MAEADEFSNVLSSRFGAAFGNVDRAPRKAQERVATRTPEEHAKSKTARTELINFKTTKAMRALLKQTASDLDVTMTEVIERGIKMVVEARGKP